jgi:hypothetical protein
MENPTVDVEISNKIPTWDEIADREPTAFDSMMDKDSWMDL